MPLHHLRSGHLRPVLLLACAVPPIACHATPIAAKATPRDEVQAAYEPRSAPGEGQQLLARMVGEWNVQKTFHPRGGGDPSLTTGTCTQTLIHDGRFLQSEFRFGTGKDASTGTGMIGFDAANQRFTSFWVDSRSTRVSVRQSAAPFDGARVELVSRTLGEEQNARQSRTETQIDADGQRIVHRQFGRGTDGEERLVMELVMQRAR
jgi:hypothetical protein